MNSLALAGILRRIYSNFNMKSFSNRLKLQKIIYLLQVSGINLGYSYSWYIYGPYSTNLTKDAFQIKNFSQSKKVGFETDSMETKFNEFLQKIGTHKDDEFWLEVASSIHLIKEINPAKTKSQVIAEIQNKRKQFVDKREDINRIWKDVEGWLV